MSLQAMLNQYAFEMCPNSLKFSNDQPEAVRNNLKNTMLVKILSSFTPLANMNEKELKRFDYNLEILLKSITEMEY